MSHPPITPFDPSPCIPADYAFDEPDELTTLRQERDELHQLLACANHAGAVNVILSLKNWQLKVIASIHPSAGITRDPDSFRGKTLVLDQPPPARQFL